MNSSEYGNYSEYGRHNDVERYLWAAYHLVILLSSLIGDTLILYASFQKDAFKLNNFLVAVLQHIAVSDLLLALSTASPRAASLLFNDWVLGNAMCYARVYISYWAYLAGIMFIAVMMPASSLFSSILSQHQI